MLTIVDEVTYSAQPEEDNHGCVYEMDLVGLSVFSEYDHCKDERHLKPEVQKLFEKYVNNDLHVRRLDHEMALQLLQKEFSLSQKAAVSVMDYFDTDRNGSLSLWEFQHFYNLAGPRVAETAAVFDSKDTEKQGYLDRDTVIDILKDMKSADGKELEDKDIEMIIKSAKDENQIFLGDFIAILYRVKLYRKGH
ncbi:hypothetical protein LSH36_27g04001 [Paralvinella palmiformis]|uniref:EF-hand domain-containing protein n=1 Tax=Paralvinella palmiformis TaxID=53620 RepID=A0AAD9NEW4_9ANNE|nr:hypothetical protein LSH36_27g04001 [Paralvinella palmiformis]